MTLTVEITWNNPHSPLIPDSELDLVLSADGTHLTPTKKEVGVRRFEVPDGTTDVVLRAHFNATFGGTTAEVLRIAQHYEVVGVTELRPIDFQSFGGPHPLVVTRGLAGRHGVASIVLRTDFVDISAFWSKYADGWKEYYDVYRAFWAQQMATPPATTIYPLGYTGGTPLIWFAVVPDACRRLPTPAASCLVFFRPAAHYTYLRIDQKHQPNGLWRYLLSPLPDLEPSARSPERDHCYSPAKAPYPGAGDLMYCRFEEAMARSGRAVVMLYPWISGGDYGVMATAALPSVSSQAIRHLWARHAIGEHTPGVTRGRLGLFGFSFGGTSMWRALQANMSKYDEVYAFDCNDDDHIGPSLAPTWFHSRPDRCLRLVGGQYRTGDYASIIDAVTGGPDSERATIALRGNWSNQTTNSVWEHFIRDVPDWRNGTISIDVKHQFVICGGQMPGGGPYDFKTSETFLQRFLMASKF